MVAPIDHGTSATYNQFWTEGPGFTPLLVGMGASMLAFTPTRFAVIAEGATDLLLLPTFFRQATGLRDLGFQVAPGLAEATPELIRSRLDLEALRVTYLVDGDSAGEKIQRELDRAGIPSERIFVLGGGGSGLTPEDLVLAHVYAKSVNQELYRSGHDFRVDVEAMPLHGRSSWVGKACIAEGIEPPKKVAVAYHILEHASEHDIIDPDRRGLLVSLYQELARTLGLDIPVEW